MNYYHNFKRSFFRVPCILIEIKILQKGCMRLPSSLCWPGHDFRQGKSQGQKSYLDSVLMQTERRKGFLLPVYGFLGHAYLGSPASEHIFLLFSPLLSNWALGRGCHYSQHLDNRIHLMEAEWPPSWAAEWGLESRCAHCSLLSITMGEKALSNVRLMRLEWHKNPQPISTWSSSLRNLKMTVTALRSDKPV